MSRILVTTFNKPGYNMGEAALFQDRGRALGYLTSDRASELWDATPAELLNAPGRGGIQKVISYPNVNVFGLMSLSSGGGLGWSRILKDHNASFRRWLTALYQEPIGCWVIGGHHASNSTYAPMHWGTDIESARDWRPYAGIGLKIGSGQLEWFGYRTAADVPRELALPEAARGLKSVSLMLILGCNGALHGRLWQQYIVRCGGKAPLVLGWEGTHTMPKDALEANASAHFWNRIRDLAPGQTLDQLCRSQTDKVIQAWGYACWEAFRLVKRNGWENDQRHLWYRKVSGVVKRAAAIAPDGTLYGANPTFQNQTGQKAMLP